MNILVVCQYFFPEQFRVNDICFELVKEGHQVTVLTGLPNYPSGVVDSRYKWFHRRREDINGVKIYRSWLVGRGKGIKRLALNYLSFAATSLFSVLMMKKDFDVILVYQLSPVTMALPGILMQKLTRKPMVVYCHDLWPESIASAGVPPNSLLYSVVLRMSRWIYSQADYIFTSSKMFEEYFSQVLNLRKNISYLPVYAEELFEQVGKSAQKDDGVDLVFAGNIGEMQSVETIILAANELKNHPEIRFHIVGDGSSRQKCEKMAQQFVLQQVFFYGYRPISEMPHFYKLADAFLVTLKSNKMISYTLPNKVQSYLAAGRPVIAAIDGETASVIAEAQCGMCCDAEDYIGLAAIIKNFAASKDCHAGYGERAKCYYDHHFSKSVYMGRLNKLLKNTVSGDEEDVY